MQTTSPPVRSSASSRRGSAAMWLSYLAMRGRGLVMVLAAIVVLTFLVVRLVPGDPARLILGPTASTESVESLRAQLGLTDSLPAQFYDYIGGILQGDLGASFSLGQPVRTVLGQRFPLTALLAGCALLVVVIIGFPLGIAAGLASRRRGGGVLSGIFSTITSVLGAVPEYILGSVLVIVFAVGLGWLPVQGGSSPREILLPSLAVGLGAAAVFARIVRNETVDVLNEEYIVTATSKRISTTRLVLRHVLPNVVTSTLTLGGVLLVALLGGTVVVENVFAMPGLGSALVRAVQTNDYPLVQGVLLVLGLTAVLINFAVDIILGVLDPRVLGDNA